MYRCRSCWPSDAEAEHAVLSARITQNSTAAPRAGTEGGGGVGETLRDDAGDGGGGRKGGGGSERGVSEAPRDERGVRQAPRADRVRDREGEDTLESRHPHGGIRKAKLPFGVVSYRGVNGGGGGGGGGVCQGGGEPVLKLNGDFFIF